jgi:phosphoglycerate dehydrogenase-like enzyme
MDTQKPKAAFFIGNVETFKSVWPEDRRKAIEARCDVLPIWITVKNAEEHLDALADVEYVFSTWGIPQLSEELIVKMTRLKAVFYAAGSVQHFARSYLKHGVRVFSAWVANGIPVAEFSLAQILLSCKGYFRNTADARLNGKPSHHSSHKGPGIYGNSVALIGFGVIARKLADLLRGFHMKVLVVDPYVTDEVIRSHGAHRATLEEAFAQAYVVSNHLPNLPATVGLLKGSLFASMRPNATFINTGRGAQVVESELIATLQARPDLTALLDVTFPEPPEADSPFYTLPNVQLSTHIAGSIGNEVVRMADYMIEEFNLVRENQPVRFEVSLGMLETMA